MVNPVSLASVPVMFAFTTNVFAPIVGALPFEPVNTGTLGSTALNKIYLFAVAPPVGKTADDHDKFICVDENAFADNELACVIGGFDNVIKFESDDNAVPSVVVAYPLK